MENLEAIIRLIERIDCLTPITEWVNKINIFDVLRLSSVEIRHSNMLAWLIDPNESHGLGGQVLRGIIQYAANEQPSEYSSFTVFRERKKIDIMAVSDKEKYVVCIENKTGTEEHDNQLDRYKQYIATAYPEYRKIMLYLSPNKKTSSDPMTWKPMGYEDIWQIVSKAKDNAELKPEAELLITNYLDTVLAISGGDKRIQKICEKIYLEHSQAIDLIFKYSRETNPGDPGQTEEKKKCEDLYRVYGKTLKVIYGNRPGKESDPVAEVIHAWADRKTEEGVIAVDPQNTTDSITRFKTAAMSKILPDAVNAISGWGTRNFYFYEIRNTRLSSQENEVSVQLCINTKGIPEELRKISDRINNVLNQKQNKMHRINFTTDSAIFRSVEKDDLILNRLDEYLEEVLSFEQKLAAKLGMCSA